MTTAQKSGDLGAMLDEFVSDEQDNTIYEKGQCCCGKDCGMSALSEHYCSKTGRRCAAWCLVTEESSEGYGSSSLCVRCSEELLHSEHSSSNAKISSDSSNFSMDNELPIKQLPIISNLHVSSEIAVDLRSLLRTILSKLAFYKEGYSEKYFYKDTEFTIRHVKFALNSRSQTKLYVNEQLMLPTLYWWDSYQGMLTNEFEVLAPMGLQDNKVFLSCWKSRCNNPIFAGIFYDTLDDNVFLVKDGWKKLIIGKRNDSLHFDFEHVSA